MKSILKKTNKVIIASGSDLDSWGSSADGYSSSEPEDMSLYLKKEEFEAFRTLVQGKH